MGFVGAAALLSSGMSNLKLHAQALTNSNTASALPATAANTLAVFDSETGFTFSEYRVAFTLSSSISFRIASSSEAQPGQPYDIVFQITAPNQVGWAGVAFGGTMVYNPLLVGWANGQQTLASTRWATCVSDYLFLIP